MNDINETVTISSLRLYADDTTQYTADYSPVVLQYLLNMTWKNYLPGLSLTIYRLTRTRPRRWSLGRSSYRYDLEFAGTPIDVNNHLKILGICLDNKLSLREHISIMLKKIYSKIGALRRLKRVVPANTMLLLYKSFVLSHLEYCNSLLTWSWRPKWEWRATRWVLHLQRPGHWRHCVPA